ncbi:MAG: hypothetical protein AB8C84_12470 [Oligoflexales bacterium]
MNIFNGTIVSVTLVASAMLSGGTEFKACLKTVHQKFVTATQCDEQWVARGAADQVGGWEVFLISVDDNGFATLKSEHQKYLTATAHDENFVVRGSADKADAWEKFKFIKNEDDSCSFKTVHNKYITATAHDENLVLRGSATENNQWEKFFLVNIINMDFMRDSHRNSEFNIPMCDLAYASNNAYSMKGFKAENGFLNYDVAARSKSNNMLAVLFLSTTDHVAIVSFQGTNSCTSLVNDAKIGCLGKEGLNNVFKQARKNFEEFRDLLRNKDVYICGHSLGGIAAQIIAGKKNIKGAAFNTMGIRNLDVYFDNRPEFYIHNTESFIHNGLGNTYLGKLVIHRGVSHRMCDLISKHFNSSCSLNLDKCSSHFRPTLVRQVANHCGGFLYRVVREKHNKLCDVFDEKNEAIEQFKKGHEDQAIEHAMNSVVAVLHLIKFRGVK